MTGRPLSAAVPSLQAAAIDTATGRFAQPWVGFFRAFGAGAPPIERVAAAGSPLVWTASGPGDLLVSGGAGVSVTLARGRDALAVPAGFVPVAAGDAVTVAFMTAPTLSFVPRLV